MAVDAHGDEPVAHEADAWHRSRDLLGDEGRVCTVDASRQLSDAVVDIDRDLAFVNVVSVREFIENLLLERIVIDGLTGDSLRQRRPAGTVVCVRLPVLDEGGKP